MPGIEAVKEMVKPPFANYDVVVYFGCGLFALPFLFHYLGKPAISALNFDFGLQPPFVASLVSALALLFSVYILGHIIAYASSQFIEKAMDLYFGKTSSVVLMAATASSASLNADFRAQLKGSRERIFTKSAWLSGVGRSVAHLPVWLAYLAIYLCGVFGFYRTRVTKEVIAAAEKKFKTLPVSGVDIAKDQKWFKSLEAYVMNNHPVATARMYNYLVISGLFRSMCLIFLSALWFEFVYTIIRCSGYNCPPGLLMLGGATWLDQVKSYSLLTIVYLFSLFSYLKFQRRYVEDAIFAFVFTKDN